MKAKDIFQAWFSLILNEWTSLSHYKICPWDYESALECSEKLECSALHLSVVLALVESVSSKADDSRAKASHIA